MIYVECNLYDGMGELSATALRLVKTTPGGSVFWRTETHPDRDAPVSGFVPSRFSTRPLSQLKPPPEGKKGGLSQPLGKQRVSSASRTTIAACDFAQVKSESESTSYSASWVES
ncbi:conserved hypothetical protein [Coccidioides posadasii str. Silveira]|uniref:Uncharacterized protein n=2 Tax=Coccidioides posadasii TaxID=199306 RepID=E9CWM6_COCPS|nr:conserved hypothetical protein [Coccidioides posadasii str. Silveira]KMM65172.1 hypothetical protein CPAG_01525 [Coccidioides posadasii RMSCC 3488]